MILLQNFLCPRKVVGIFGFLSPGKFKNSLEVSPLHIHFRKHGVHSSETVNFSVQLFPYFFTDIQRIQLLFKLIRFRVHAFVSEFLPDHLDLFPQNILPLILIYTFLDLALDLLLNLQDTDLVHQDAADHLIPGFLSQCFQHSLPLLPGNGELHTQHAAQL